MFFNFGSNLVVGLVFPLVLVPYLNTWSFLPFAILLTLYSVFALLFLPETKGVPVKETSILLQQKRWRNRQI